MWWMFLRLLAEGTIYTVLERMNEWRRFYELLFFKCLVPIFDLTAHSCSVQRLLSTKVIGHYKSIPVAFSTSNVPGRWWRLASGTGRGFIKLQKTSQWGFLCLLTVVPVYKTIASSCLLLSVWFVHIVNVGWPCRCRDRSSNFHHNEDLPVFAMNDSQHHPTTRTILLQDDRISVSRDPPMDNHNNNNRAWCSQTNLQYVYNEFVWYVTTDGTFALPILCCIFCFVPLVVLWSLLQQPTMTFFYQS